jgi:fructose-bisphosphate aldolase class II
MALVTGNDLLIGARAEGYGVGAFNTDNLETTQAILEAAEATRSPVMLAITEGAMRYSRERVVDIALIEAAAASVPVAIHLDHGESYEICLRCLRLGFTSVMIDASQLDEAGNVRETRRVVEAAHAVGVSVEAEIGVLGGIEEHLEVDGDSARLTSPDEAARFIGASGADSLAIAIGTAHGPNKGRGRPFIDHERLRAIAARVAAPLVMHGASGIPPALSERLNRAGGALKNAVGIHEDDIARAVAAGVAKVNVGTDLRLAGMTAIRETLQGRLDLIDLRKILDPARSEMRSVIEQRMRVVGSAGRAA